jgi:hypothetical protein
MSSSVFFLFFCYSKYLVTHQKQGKNAKQNIISQALCVNYYDYFLFLVEFKWQNIVSNFSDLEFKVIVEEQRSAETGHHKNEDQLSSSGSSSGSLDTRQQICSCIVDRNRIVKHSVQGGQPKHALQHRQNCLSSSHNLINQSAAVITNMALFYELMQAMPELSKLEIR